MTGKKEAVFFLKFTAIFLFLEALIFTLDFSFLQEFIAVTIAGILGLESNGKFIFSQNGTFEIVASCTGLVSGSILASTVFSLKKPALKQKTALFLGGFALLLVINYFRVLLVIGVGKELGMGAAEALHVVSWLFTAIIVLGIWYWGTKKAAKVKDFKGFL